MQGIEGSVNTMNPHGLMCANAMIQAMLGVQGDGVPFKTNVEIMLPELWQAQYNWVLT